jgi:hypothetical protein
VNGPKHQKEKRSTQISFSYPQKTPGRLPYLLARSRHWLLSPLSGAEAGMFRRTSGILQVAFSRQPRERIELRRLLCVRANMLRSNASQNRTTKRANREFARDLRQWDVRELVSENHRECAPEIL